MGKLQRIVENSTDDPGPSVHRAQSLAPDPDAALAEISAQIGSGPFALIALFVTTAHRPQAVAMAVHRHLPGQTVIGATTAGEIGLDGYLDGAIVAVALPLQTFRASVLKIPDLAHFSPERTVVDLLRTRGMLAGSALNWPNEFAFLLSDGLSLKEEQIVSTLGPALGETPLFGGSAGDGVRFGRTLVFVDGGFHENMAVLTFIRTQCRIRVFRLDHLTPTEMRMVVTRADPARRLVHEINAEPAAKAYARAAGKDPDRLWPFVFASDPVVVRVGGKHHVLAVQRVEPNGDLRFFSAVETGTVLTLAEGQDLAAHLERALDDLSPDGPPDAIIACECVLRRLEIDAQGLRDRLRPTLARHRVLGFNSYGEQFNMLHVNQTFTGVAIYPPPPESAPG